MNRLPELTFGHIYRWEELTGKTLDQLDASSVRDIGLLLYIMGGEPANQKPHEYLNQFKISDLKAMVAEIKGAMTTGPLAAVPKAKEAKGAE